MEIEGALRATQAHERRKVNSIIECQIEMATEPILEAVRRARERWPDSRLGVATGGWTSPKVLHEGEFPELEPLIRFVSIEFGYLMTGRGKSRSGHTCPLWDTES